MHTHLSNKYSKLTHRLRHAQVDTHAQTDTHLSNKCSKLVIFLRFIKQVEAVQYNRLVNREQQISDINLWQVIAVIGVTRRQLV